MLTGTKKMNKKYHQAITRQACQGLFNEHPLEVIIQANIHQDRLRGQIGHPEFHFDSNAFESSQATMEANRREVVRALQDGEAVPAWQAFGRLIHAAQDFYAHSNYVTLWLERFPADAWPEAEQIDPLDETILSMPMRSGKIYWPLEPLSFIPLLRPLILPFLRRDSHAWMNLDSEKRGPKFAFAYAAAVKRTKFEYQQTVLRLNEAQRNLFTG